MCGVAAASMRRGKYYCNNKDDRLTINDFNPSAPDDGGYDADRPFTVAANWQPGDERTAFPIGPITCECDDTMLSCTDLRGGCLACDTGDAAPKCSE